MRSLLDLSFRIKIPLWGSLLIVVAALALSALLIVQAYDDLRRDLLDSSFSLGRTLATTLFSSMLHEDVWRAYEIIRAPLEGETGAKVLQPELVFVLDEDDRVFVSSDPASVPLLADLRQAGSEYRELLDRIAAHPVSEIGSVELTQFRRLYVIAPIADEGAYLGRLVIVHSKEALLSRFRDVAWRGAGIGLAVLAILLPVNWFWGQRIALPLVQLTNSIVDVSRGVVNRPPRWNYSYHDELGRLFDAYGAMVESLREKDRLEQGIIRAERLAAIGRLSAGIAHEINNPLAGMLVALSNFRRRDGHDERTLATVSMLERGLGQIREIVQAMLVDVKVKVRHFTPQDIEDVKRLLASETGKRSVTIDLTSNIVEPIPLPATLVRQVLMNLLLNAVQASDPAGEVRCGVHVADGQLLVDTENSGRLIPSDVADHLFEPFASGSESGHGLGLWVVYQIATQQGGRIHAESSGGFTRFSVILPIGDES